LAKSQNLHFYRGDKIGLPNSVYRAINWFCQIKFIVAIKLVLPKSSFYRGDKIWSPRFIFYRGDKKPIPNISNFYRHDKTEFHIFDFYGGDKTNILINLHFSFQVVFNTVW
jgi:hypothetical protein